MTVLLRKGDPPDELRRKVDKVLKRQGALDASRFCGVVAFPDDGLAIQQKLRAEWDGPRR